MADLAFKKLSFQERYEVMEKLQNGELVKNLAPEYETTIRRIYRNREKLSGIVGLGGERLSHRRVMQEPSVPPLDSYLISWFEEQWRKGMQVTNLEMMKKAMEINKMIGGPTHFNPSLSWLYRFKSRNGIQFRERKRKQRRKDDTSAKVLPESFEPLQNSSYGNIYKMVITVLLWRAFPSKTAPGSAERLHEDTELKKDRVAVGLCANVLGNHKLEPLFLYNKDATRISNGETPVVFKTEPKSWLDQGLFIAWYNNCFKPAVQRYQLENGKSGKVILWVDSKQGSVIPKEMMNEDNFEIICMPNITGSLLQPMEQSIVEKTKTIFRRKILQKMVALNNNTPQFDVRFDICDCMAILAQAWTEIRQSDIFNCWKKIFVTLPELIAANVEPADLLQPPIREAIGALHGEKATEEDEKEFLRRCIEMENEMSNDDECNMDEPTDVGDPLESDLRSSSMSPTTSITSDLGSDAPPNTKQIDDVLSILMSWSKNEPNYIQKLVEIIHSHRKDKCKNVGIEDAT